MVRISIDWENNAEDFWAAVHAALEEPAGLPHSIRESIRKLAEEADSITLSPPIAQELWAWAMGLPGWDTGPQFAKYPLLKED